MALFRPYQQSTPEQRAEKKKAADQRAAEEQARQARLAQERQAVAEESASAESAEAESATAAGGTTTPETKAAARSGSGRKGRATPAAPSPAAPVGESATDESAAQGQDTSTQTPVRRGYTPKKGRVTPTRAEAEAARKQRVNPQLSPKEQRKADRQARMQRNQDSYAKAELEPTRVLLRDYIDSRWTVTEFIFPVVILLFALSMAFARYPLVVQGISLVMLLVFVGWIFNVWWVWRGFKKEARERIKSPQFRGLLMYGNARMMSIRRFRRPAPRISRGEDY